jgi:hypothetical protein
LAFDILSLQGKGDIETSATTFLATKFHRNDVASTDSQNI